MSALPAHRCQVLALLTVTLALVVAGISDRVNYNSIASRRTPSGDGGAPPPPPPPSSSCCVTYNVKEYHVHRGVGEDQLMNAKWAEKQAGRRQKLKWLRRVEKLQTQLIVKRQKHIVDLGKRRTQLRGEVMGSNRKRTGSDRSVPSSPSATPPTTEMSADLKKFITTTKSELHMIKSGIRTSGYRNNRLYRAYRRLSSSNHQLREEFDQYRKQVNYRHTKIKEEASILRDQMANETSTLRRMIHELSNIVRCPRGKCPEGETLIEISPTDQKKKWMDSDLSQSDSEFKVLIHNAQQLEFLKARAQSSDLPSVGDLPSLGRIIVNKANAQFIQMELSAQNIPYWSVTNNHTQSLKRKPEDDITTRRDEEELTRGHYNFKRYLNIDQVYHYMRKRKSKCGRKCELLHIGKSYENQNLLVLKIVEPAPRNVRKRSIWIDGGTHAREWVSVSTALYFIDKLLDDEDEDAEMLRDMYDWYIMPITNPDGYRYTFEKDRMWRKTRMPNERSDCVGVDPNRNYGFKWGVSGSTSDPCTETYGGTSAFTQPETIAISDYIINRNGTWEAFLTLHSFSQLWMAPWGYSKDKPDNYKNMEIVGKKAIDALYKVSGTKYKLGSASSILYASSGTSRDWAKGVARIPYVFTVELRDQGQYGFLLPATEIIGTGSETWAALVAMTEAMNQIERRSRRSTSADEY